MRTAGSYSDFTLADVVAALRPARPETLLKYAEAFRLADEAVLRLHTQLPATIHRVTTGDAGRWAGPAATAFVEHSTKATRDALLRTGSFDQYAVAMTRAAQALAEAKTQLAICVERVDTRRGGAGAQRARSEAATIHAEARAIIERLASVYAEAGACLTGSGPADAPSPGPAREVMVAESAADESYIDKPVPEPDDAPAIARRRGDVVDVSLGNPGASALGVFADSTPSSRRSLLAGALSVPTLLSDGTHPGASGVVDVGLGNPLVPSACVDVASTPGPAPTQLASTGRLPGLGARDYTPPPNAPVMIRSRPGALLASELLARGSASQPGRPGSVIADEDEHSTSEFDGVIGRPSPPRRRADG